MTTIELPSSLKSINKYAFYGAGLTKILIPESVATIEEDAFGHCENLTEVTLPNGLAWIGQFAFCFTGLTKVVIPENVTNIFEGAFYYCTAFL